MSLADDLLNAVFNGANYTSPAGTYIGLFVNGAEISGGNYARVPTTGLWEQALNGEISNSAQIRFNKPSALWGTITEFAIFDAITDGNILVGGQLKTPIQGDINVDIFMNPNMLRFSISI